MNPEETSPSVDISTFPKLPLSLRRYFPPRLLDRYFKGRVYEGDGTPPVVEG